jgi:hypothetical protein
MTKMMIEAVEHLGFSVAMSNFGIGYPFFWMNLIMTSLRRQMMGIVSVTTLW